jgi:hypothetical protein
MAKATPQWNYFYFYVRLHHAAACMAQEQGSPAELDMLAARQVQTIVLLAMPAFTIRRQYSMWQSCNSV